MTIPFVLTYSFEAVLKDGLSVFQNSRPNVVEVSKLFGLKIYFQTLSARCRTRSCLRSRVLQPLVVRLSPWQVLPPELCILHRNSSVSHFLFSLLRGGIFIISHLETGCQLLLYQIIRGGVEFCYVCIDDDTAVFFALEAQDNAGLLVDAHGEGIDPVLCREIIGRDAGYNDA